MPNDNWDRLEKIRRAYVCSNCGAELVVIWDAQASLYALACGKDKSHKGVKKRVSIQKAIQQGSLDEHVAPGAQNRMEKAIASLAPEYTFMAKNDVATGRELSLAQVQMLVKFAEQCGLRAWLGHVCLYFGEPYVTVDGYYWKKNHDKLNFYVVCDPMTPDERTAYQVKDGDHAFIGKAITPGGDVITKSIGIVTLEEINEPSKKKEGQYASPIAHDKPQRMAEKRAEWQLLSKTVPLGFEPQQQESTPHEPLPRAELSQAEIDELWTGESSR